MKVLVGLSGGVDSSVAALILKQQGHEVIGATMSIWGKDGMALKSGHKNACYGPDEKEDIEEARRIAEQIGIPYYVFDCVEQYEKIVLDNFKSEYIQGRTPNPCIWCNALVKFGVLPHMAKVNGIEFDKFATGHYARVEQENSRFLLKKGIASNKDQSYFLYRLSQDTLSNIILPLGNYSKDEIRQIAKDNGLNVAEKPDSQDFYDGDYNELLGLQEKIGNIVDVNGKILGTHKGIWNYTIGQRKGLGVAASEPMYVLELKKDTNEVVIGPADKTFKKSLRAVNLNWISIDGLKEEMQVCAKIRSTQKPANAVIKPDGDGVDVEFDELQKSIAIGQSVVFYDEDRVIGGGIIDSVE
ncbi:tRNA 2-thiouridine(34) synthase MnmA [bacterium]|nr:tRNA 2-thiouridine(34) synthase MnmA [bacterium]